jgi:hypothetical protein
MPFRWEIPNKPPDRAALDRMKQHFPKPPELMPMAWFMNAEINYYTPVAETDPAVQEIKVLVVAMNEIAGGIVAFPEIDFVRTWRVWFHYLLPYTIARVEQDPEMGSLLNKILATFICVYPRQITEEYDGFRDDVVHSLGSRIFSTYSSPGQLDFGHVTDLLYVEPSQTLSLYDDLGLPMLFALKYLKPVEITDWVRSIVHIESHAWRFALITWWLSFKKFLRLAQNWPQSGELQILVEVEDGLVDDFWISRLHYESLHTFIPQSNLTTFQDSFAEELTPEVYSAWILDITTRATVIFNKQSIPIPKLSLDMIKLFLNRFEREFFGQAIS